MHLYFVAKAKRLSTLPSSSLLRKENVELVAAGYVSWYLQHNIPSFPILSFSPFSFGSFLVLQSSDRTAQTSVNSPMRDFFSVVVVAEGRGLSFVTSRR